MKLTTKSGVYESRIADNKKLSAYDVLHAAEREGRTDITARELFDGMADGDYDYAAIAAVLNDEEDNVMNGRSGWVAMYETESEVIYEVSELGNGLIATRWLDYDDEDGEAISITNGYRFAYIGS